MTFPVSIQLKKDFLQWFHDTYTKQFYELDWFMEELIEDERALFHLYFVDEIDYCPKGIILTVHENDEVTFQFFKNHIKTTDIYTAYHELHLYRQDPFYIQINFHHDERPEHYEQIVENEQSYDYNIKEETDLLLQYLLTDGKEKYIKDEIDIALENGEVERFRYLTTLLHMKQQ